MAVARHSDNIELQEEDHIIYENETTVTVQDQAEMSAEGHYDRLDLPNTDDAVYEVLQTKTQKEKDLEKIMQSVIVVAVCLGMLCLLLLGGNIGQAVHSNSIFNNLTKMTADYNKLILENNQLKSNSNLTQREKAGNFCPSGWMKFGESCYYRSTEEKTWEESREECLKTGSDLVVINSQEELDFIKGLTDGTSWIGLKKTRNWICVDGTPLETGYTWYNGASGNGDCMYENRLGLWVTELCLTDKRRWTCEKMVSS